jgi:hypothetical protein
MARWSCLSFFVLIGALSTSAAEPFNSSLARSANAATSTCSSEISSCGCTIRKQGVYTVTTDLNVTTGLTPDGACLELQATDIVLNLNNHAITGSGQSSLTIGIDVQPASNNDTILGGDSQAVVQSWDIGVRLQANGGTIARVAANNCNLASFELDHASRNLLTGWVASAEAIGVWIKSGHNNFVTNGAASSTGYAGIVLGCAEGYERYCDAGQAVANTLLNNEADWNGRYGVALSARSSNTTVNASTALGNNTDDMFDSNAACGSDTWIGNTLGRRNDP